MSFAHFSPAQKSLYTFLQDLMVVEHLLCWQEFCVDDLINLSMQMYYLAPSIRCFTISRPHKHLQQCGNGYIPILIWGEIQEF